MSVAILKRIFKEQNRVRKYQQKLDKRRDKHGSTNFHMRSLLEGQQDGLLFAEVCLMEELHDKGELDKPKVIKALKTKRR